MRRLSGRVIFLFCAPLVACGQQQQPSGLFESSDGPLPAIGRNDVDYVSGTVALEGAQAARVIAHVDEDRVVLRSDASEAADVREGGFLVTPLSGMRRIVSVSATAEGMELQTSPAALHEVIRDGTLEWSLPVEWDDVLEAIPDGTRVSLEEGELVYTRPPQLASLFPVSAAAPGRIDFSGKSSGWDLSGFLKPGAFRVDYEFKASRTARGQKNVAISGAGWISGFVNETMLTYEQSTPTRMNTKTIGLKGEIEIKWAAFMVGNETMSEDVWLDLPFAVPLRFAVGAIPMQLNIKAKAQIVPTFIFEKSSSGGSFKIQFDSDQGISYDNQIASPVGQLRGSDIAVSGETVTASLESASFGVGFEFPRLEIGPLGHAVAAFITVKSFAAGTFISSALKACQKGEASVRAVAGYKLSTPIASISDQTEIWKKDFEKHRNRKCTE